MDRHSLDRADLGTCFLTLKIVKSKLRVEYISKFTSIFQVFYSISILYSKLVSECGFAHPVVLFYHIWLKTVRIVSPKEHEKKRWETLRHRAEEIARCVDQNSERNSPKILDGKSPLFYVKNRVRMYVRGRTDVTSKFTRLDGFTISITMVLRSRAFGARASSAKMFNFMNNKIWHIQRNDKRIWISFQPTPWIKY